jgi:hypothetical protein
MLCAFDDLSNSAEHETRGWELLPPINRTIEYMVATTVTDSCRM